MNIQNEKIEIKISEKDKQIINLLIKNKPAGLRVQAIKKITNLPQRTIYNRLKFLEMNKIVINNFPIWNINKNIKWNFKEIKNKKIFINKNNLGVSSLKLDRCYFCPYDKVLDLHHIKEKSKGGKNNSDNLLILCPNCHTLIHRKKLILKKINNDWIAVDEKGTLILKKFE